MTGMSSRTALYPTDHLDTGKRAHHRRPGVVRPGLQVSGGPYDQKTYLLFT